ncbi:uncharacterized protein LOC133843525 [Drosophila sulfurigaster albostrigata]|uniref:uncharacterized protein LOC133843525 n=1 Tax=Drosophila sulfurigaster albostrigata TaxID=89887 RepID=UPI002D21C93E|nr:uncharacterized protein LOC133843525 [Drosophila sulfurigaster albostrigata]
MGFVCFLLLLLSGILIFTAALDELEIDPQVAPPTVGPRHTLWHNLMGQVRQALKRWQPTVRTSTTVQPRIHLRSTTEPELEYYGALNPIYQMNNF